MGGMEPRQHYIIAIVAILVAGLAFVSAVRTCGEYNAKLLEVQKACVQSGSSPLECGVVRVTH